VKPRDPRLLPSRTSRAHYPTGGACARRADLDLSLPIDLFTRVDEVGITFQRAQPGVYLAVTRSFAAQKSETKWLKIISSGA
jgi:hypothetical protein